jgi:hypothetical protein
MLLQGIVQKYGYDPACVTVKVTEYHFPRGMVADAT